MLKRICLWGGAALVIFPLPAVLLALVLSVNGTALLIMPAGICAILGMALAAFGFEPGRHPPGPCSGCAGRCGRPGGDC